MKATAAICDPNDNVAIPLNAKKTDWEERSTTISLVQMIGQAKGYRLIRYFHCQSNCL